MSNVNECFIAVVKDFLTNADSYAYKVAVNPPGSFGERVRGRSERSGSCFFRWRQT